MQFGAIEAGGTKFLCAVGDDSGRLWEVTRIPTTSPEETLGQVVDYFTSRRVAGLGVGCFGPADLNRRSPTWGHITRTPKPGWSDTDVAGMLQQRLGVMVAFDTDVNAAARAERRWGAGRGLEDFVYITVGTGVGGGGFCRGRTIRGLVHPEIGHMRVPRLAGDDFPGVCPFHGDCLEGLIAGPALLARTGQAPESLPDAHPAWEIVARYLALGVANLVMVLSPRRVILGGGVMKGPGLLGRVRTHLVITLSGYPPHAHLADPRDFVVAPELGDHAGLKGALALALRLPQERP